MYGRITILFYSGSVCRLNLFADGVEHTVAMDDRSADLSDIIEEIMGKYANNRRQKLDAGIGLIVAVLRILCYCWKCFAEYRGKVSWHKIRC